MSTPSTASVTRPRARRIIRKTTILAAAGGLLTAGVAVAAWTATNSGNGAGKSIARQLVQVSTGTATADLYPGAKGDVVVSITNPNPYTVSLSSVAAGTGITAGNAGCNVGDAVSYRFTSLNLNAAIGAGQTYVLTIDDAIAMNNAAVDACADSTFTVPVTINAASDPSATTSTSGSVTAP